MSGYDDQTDEEREYDLFLIELGDSISPAAREELAHVLAAEYRAAHGDHSLHLATLDPELGM